MRYADVFWKTLNNNNVVVGLHVKVTLTVLLLALPAFRVIDLGAEKAFEKLCFKLAAKLTS